MNLFSIKLIVHRKLQKIKPSQNRAIRAVNNSSFKSYSDPTFFRLELLNLDNTYKLGVLSFMHKYFMKTFQLSSMICVILQRNKIEQNHINLNGFSLKLQNVFPLLYFQKHGIRLNQSLKKLYLQNHFKKIIHKDLFEQLSKLYL